MTVTESHDKTGLVTKRDAATALKVSVRTIDRYIANGTLDSIRVSIRATRITRDSLNALLTPESSPTTRPVDDTPVSAGRASSLSGDAA